MTVEQNILCGLKTERRPRCPPRCLRRDAARHAAGDAGQTLPRPAFRRAGSSAAALARILVGKPRILMLDEPFSALDSYLREEVEGEVGSLLANLRAPLCW
ncbi:MAG: hypothetical protein ACLVJH_12315 [Faecalibacterium prausnitzii]